MVEDLGAADGGGRRGFQAELRPRKAEEWVSALLAATKEIRVVRPRDDWAHEFAQRYRPSHHARSETEFTVSVSRPSLRALLVPCELRG